MPVHGIDVHETLYRNCEIQGPSVRRPGPRPYSENV